MDYKILSILGLVLSVSACGGGGGGSSSGTSSPTSDVVIDSGAVADNVALKATSA